MEKAIGAIALAGVLGLLLLGPAYLAVSAHETSPVRCVGEVGCDARQVPTGLNQFANN